MAGVKVTRDILDMKAAETILELRKGLSQARTVASFLATLPSDAPGGDPLTKPVEEGGEFGYTADEAYLLRYVFEGIDAVEVQPLVDAGRLLTGLQ